MMFAKQKRLEKANDEISRLRLPKNRWQSFWDCVSNHTSQLIACGFMATLFALPLMIILGLTNILVFDLNYQIGLGTITVEEGVKAIFNTMNTANLFTIPAIILLFIGLSGLVRIIRRLIWQEDIFFWFDFRKGVKENWGSFLASGLIVGVANWTVQLLIRYGYFIDHSSWYEWALPISIAVAVLLIPILTYTLVQTDIYVLSFSAKMKNAFLLTMRTAPATFGFVALVFAPWGIFWISMNEVLYLVLLAFFFIIFVPLEILAINEYCLHVFDRFINKMNHPEIFDKGIYRVCQK